MTLHSNLSPLELCEEFTRKELNDLQDQQIWPSWWPVMSRILDRSHELEPVYAELCSAFGCSLEGNIPFRLTMEAIWHSKKAFSPDTIAHKKAVHAELIQLHEDIPTLSRKLAEAISRQKELAEPEDFDLGEYFSFVDIIHTANEANGHYNSYLRPQLEELEGQFDGKYWPDLARFIVSVGQTEADRPKPISASLPETVIKSRANRFKNYVLSLDDDIENCRQIPTRFQLSNTSMATIANVVLDLSVGELITPDTVRVIRNRRKHCTPRG